MQKHTSLAVTLALLVSLFAPLVGAQQPRPVGSGPQPVTPAQPFPQPSPARRPQPDTPRPQQQRQQARPGAPTPAAQDDEDDVVRITTNLVQVDAVVVDKKGKQVTNLTADDFEVTEDRRPQPLTFFSYVSNESALRPERTETDAAGKSADKKTVPALPEPPRRLRPEQVRRTMALVVDDLGLSFSSTAFVRESLRKFVNEQMQPNDLVAIIRTSAGAGALQQFTSDKRQLLAAIERVKWNLNGRGGIAAFARIEDSTAASGLASGVETDIVGNPVADRSQGDGGGELENFREEIFSVGTLGALNFVIRGMRELPGRKSVLLLSEGFALFNADRGGRSDRVYQSMRQLTDLANRASVVVYSIDPRGLIAPGPSAEDDVSGLTDAEISAALQSRNDELLDSQSSLGYLSQQTGGFLIKNNNDLTGGIRRVVEDQKGYYLLGYRPESATFDRRFHRISVKIKRPGLKVRTRTGFFGIRDEETRPLRYTREQQLLAALTSPFASPDVHMRLTTVFGNTAQEGSFMRSLMHIEGRDLKFTREADGKYKAVIDVVGMTFGDNGRVIDGRDRIHTLLLPEQLYQQALREGLSYTLNVSIKKAGAYQLRMAVRDAATERTGSASQFIEAPDLKKNRLALSGLIVSSLRAEETAPQVGANSVATASAPSAPSAENNQPAEGASSGPETLGSPAVRRFRQSSTLVFGYVIFNARLEKTTSRPQIITQTRIFRDGQIVYTGKEQPLDVTNNSDLKRLSLFLRLQLGSNLTPGEYVLQVVVTDLLAKENDKGRIATQWIDFEIVK